MIAVVMTSLCVFLQLLYFPIQRLKKPFANAAAFACTGKDCTF